MAINYRNEVDSGYDRKRIVESNIIALLKEGIPIEIITKSPQFNFKHFEMARNLEKGYIGKETQILEIYGGYDRELSGQIVSDTYSGVSHPVGGELYPMTEEEEKEKFQLRDNYIIEIEKLKNKEIKKLEKEKNKIITNITKYKTKFPVIDKIIEAIEEIHNIQELKAEETFDIQEYSVILRKYGLIPSELIKYDKIYSDYNGLLRCLTEVTGKLETAFDGKISTDEIKELSNKKNELETEIIQRNTKLVNGFIRQKYPNLLVETDELFQVCYISMWEAVKNFDVSKKHKFSSLAYEYMDKQVKHSFKQLTGYSWEDYWTRRKIKTILENTSKLLGIQVSVAELIEYGFLDISEKKACALLGLVDEFSFSDIYDSNYGEYDVNSQYELYFGDDEINDYEETDTEKIVVNYDLDLINQNLSEEINVALSSLTEREKLVIALRFGLNNMPPQTLEEVANVIGVTRERVRQIEAKAFRKLRHPLRLRRLKDFLGNDFSEEYNGPRK